MYLSVNKAPLREYELALDCAVPNYNNSCHACQLYVTSYIILNPGQLPLLRTNPSAGKRSLRAVVVYCIYFVSINNFFLIQL